MKYDDQFPIRQQMKEHDDRKMSVGEWFLIFGIVAIVAAFVLHRLDEYKSREPHPHTLILPQDEPEFVTLKPVRKTRVAEILYEGEE